MSSQRVRAKTRGTLRDLLRLSRQEFLSTEQPGSMPSQRNPWVRHILARYRASADLKDKGQARIERQRARELLGLFSFLTEQRGLIARYGQIDIDSKNYREAAAARVGLALPEQEPIPEKDLVQQYDLAAKLHKLKGIAGMKAQLYGVADVLRDSSSPALRQLADALDAQQTAPGATSSGLQESAGFSELLKGSSSPARE